MLQIVRSEAADPTIGEAPRRAAVEVAPYALAAAAFAAYAVVSVSTYERYADRSWDLAIFTEAVRGYAHGHWPTVAIKGAGFNLLGDHFSPILALLAPIYRIFPTPVTLQIAQAALFAIAVIPVTATAMRHLGRSAGIAVGAAYSLAWGIQSAVSVDFHEIAFAVPLLAFALRAALERRWTQAVAWSAPLVLVKEDLGLTVAAVGMVALIVGARRIGAGLLAGGVAASALTVLVVIPAFNPQHRYAYWPMLGHQPPNLLTALMGLPAEVLTPQPKLHTLLLLAAITAGISLQSPFCLVAAPTLGWRLLSTNHAYWGTDWQYSAVLMPIVFIAAIDGIDRARRSSRGWLAGYAQHAPAVMVTAAVLLTGTYPLHNLWASSTYQPSTRGSAASAAVRLIPAGATVEADTGLMSQLAAHHTVYWIGNTGTVTPNYVVIDANAGWAPSAPADAAAYAMGLHPTRHYRLIYSNNGYQVAQHVDSLQQRKP